MKKIILPLFFVLSVSGCSGSGMTESPLSSDSMPHSETHSSQSETEPYTLYIKTVRQYLSYAPTKIEVFQNGEPSTIDLYYEIEDEEICTIENGYVTGLKIGETRVYASSIDGTETSFAVSIEDPDDYPFNRDVQSKEEAYLLRGNYIRPTLFVGDSFFDQSNFWTTFYDDFEPEKKCVSVGISSTKTTDWVICRDRLLFNYQPKNLILHIGTNDINDTSLNLSVDDYYRQITAFLDLCVSHLPDTEIYFFGIENRAGSAGGKNAYAERVTEKIRREYAPLYGNFTYIDSPSVFNADQDKYISSDQIHPSKDGYAYYVEILNRLVDF